MGSRYRFVMRNAALLSLVVMVGCGQSASTPAGSSSASTPAGSSSASASASAKPTGTGDPWGFRECSGSNDKWVGLPLYEGAKPICCRTTSGLPHIFTTVFATSDSVATVESFYEKKIDAKTKFERKDGVASLSREAPGNPQLRIDSVNDAPAGCEPAASDATIISVTDQPPYH